MNIYLSGKVAQIFKTLKDDSGYSATRVMEELLRLAEKSTEYKRQRDLLIENYSHGHPQSFIPPQPQFIAPKPLKIDIRISGEVKADFAHELKQIIGLRPSEIIKLYEEVLLKEITIDE